VAKALVDPNGSIKGTEREPFAVGAYRVRGFEAQFPNGPFVRRLVFLLTKDVPFAPPTTVMLSSDPMTALIGKADDEVLFLDEYFCGGHATLEQIP